MSKNKFEHLRQFTSARIGLGRVGSSLKTIDLLKFQLDHALAKDAVMAEVDFDALATNKLFKNTSIILETQAENREIYLQRPDLGRKINEKADQRLKKVDSGLDLALILGDGLSAAAVENHAIPLIRALTPKLKNFSCTPWIMVKNARVAVGDDIGFHTSVKLSVILIGERPGLSTPDSLGIYFTYNPKPGLTDERRNCISNIHGNGLSYELAAEKLAFLLYQSLKLQISGVKLKDNSQKNLD